MRGSMQFTGHIQVAGAVHDLGGLHAEPVHGVLSVHGLVGTARALQQAEQGRALRVRLLNQRRGAVRVVPDGAIAAAVETGPEQQYQQDQDQNAATHSYGPADHEGLTVACRTAA